MAILHICLDHRLFVKEALEFVVVACVVVPVLDACGALTKTKSKLNAVNTIIQFGVKVRWCCSMIVAQIIYKQTRSLGYYYAEAEVVEQASFDLFTLDIECREIVVRAPIVECNPGEYLLLEADVLHAGYTLDELVLVVVCVVVQLD